MIVLDAWLRRRFVGWAALMAFAVSCDEPCVTGPCPLELAIVVRISPSGTARSVENAFVRDASQPDMVYARCSGSIAECDVRGNSGTYSLEIGAAGFLLVTRTVVVSPTGKMCGCDRVKEEELAVSLVPAP